MRRQVFAGPPALARWIGAVLVGAGFLGLLISATGLFLVATVGTTAEAALERQLEALDKALLATSDGLAVAESSIAEARLALASLSATVDNVNRAIGDTQPTIDRLQEITGTGIPQTIDSTRQALASAQETARIADGVLGTVAIFGLRYDPDVPLNVAIEQVSASLGELPASLEQVSAGLETTNENMATVAGDLTRVARNIDAIGANVGEAAAVVDQYQVIVGDLRDDLATLREAVPFWLLSIRSMTILMLIWLALAQVGLLTQGWQLMGGEQEDREA